MSTLNKTVTPNNLSQAQEALKKIKDYEVPTEIPAEEAAHTHYLLGNVTFNHETLETKSSFKVLAMNDEVLIAMKDHFKTLGYSKVILLHDGKQYRNEGQNELKEEPEEEKPVINLEAENLKKEIEAKEGELASKNQEIEAKEGELASKNQEIEALKAQLEKTNNPETKTEDKAANTEAKKTSGKG